MAGRKFRGRAVAGRAARILAWVATIWAHAGIAAVADVCPFQVLDDSVVHVQSAADAEAVRTNLIRYIWGQDTLPTGFADLTTNQNVSSPFECDPNLERVDQFDLVMGPPGHPVDGRAWYFKAARRNNRLAIFHDGHFSCDPSEGVSWEDGLGDSWGMQASVNALLDQGFDVLFAQMPFFVLSQCWGDHAALFDADYAPASGSPFRYFLDTTLESLNYLESLNAYDDVSMMGLSGGGWTTTLYPAIDTRIRMSFPVAGSVPLYLRGTTGTALMQPSLLGLSAEAATCGDYGDEEQLSPDLYSIAGYPDLYVLGASGAGREQVQILNRQDSCCFGQMQEADPASFDSDIRTYERNVRRAVRSIGSGSFRLEVDEASTHHQLSRNALHNIILAELNGARSKVGAASAAQAFRRGDDGRLWSSNASGWQDRGFRIVGAPAVVENAAYPLQLVVRNAVNEPELIYFDGAQWGAIRLPASNGSVALPGGKIIADPVAASFSTGQVDVFAQGTDFNFYHWKITGSSQALELAGGSTYSVGAPAAAIVPDGSGSLRLSYRSGEQDDPATSCIERPNVLYQLAQDAGGAWQSEQRINGISTFTFPAAGNYSGRQQTYLLDANNQFSNYDGGPLIQITSGGPAFAGSPGQPFPTAGGLGVAFYARTSGGDLAQIAYDNSWSYFLLDLSPGSTPAPQSAIDSPMDTPGGVYWTGSDGQVRFYNGAGVQTLDAVDSLFLDDFEGAISP